MRHSVGFDRFNDLFETMVKTTEDRFDSYPPYNIEKLGDDRYRIVMAVAGFGMDDLTITAEGDKLTVAGKIEEKSAEDSVTYLHRGIATRAFQRTFRLADHIRVDGASLDNGLLTVNLLHEVPEAQKPRMIPIGGVQKTIEGKKKN
jgi:molecular chaperone IbpA